MTVHQTKQTIPVVDLNDFKHGTSAQRAEFVQTLGRSLEEIGFFALENHGVDSALIDKAYGLARQFYDLPLQTKKQYEIENLHGQRGYTNFGKEHAKGYAAANLKEFWHVGQVDCAPGTISAGYAQNLWPTEIPAFQPVFSDLFRQVEGCGRTLLQACSEYLGESPSLLQDMALNGDTILRVLHYPPVPADRDPASIRAAAHEDINLITLLCESTDEGLELLQRDGTWLPIHALHGQIIVDSGDMLQNLTNGILRSTTHRVVNPNNDRSRRFSMPCFVHPRSEVRLDPLPSTIKRCGGEQRYPNITAGEYLAERLRELGLKS